MSMYTSLNVLFSHYTSRLSIPPQIMAYERNNYVWHAATYYWTSVETAPHSVWCSQYSYPDVISNFVALAKGIISSLLVRARPGSSLDCVLGYIILKIPVPRLIALRLVS